MMSDPDPAAQVAALQRQARELSSRLRHPSHDERRLEVRQLRTRARLLAEKNDVELRPPLSLVRQHHVEPGPVIL